MDVGLSLSPCLTSPLRVSCVLVPRHEQLAAKSNRAFFSPSFVKDTLHVFCFSGPRIKSLSFA